MLIDKRAKKVVILLAIFGVLVIGRVIMYFSWEYQPSLPGEHRLPPKEKEISVVPTENNPQEIFDNGLLFGHYTLEVNLPLNPEVEVGYLIPADQKTGKPLSSAENMVFYGIANGEGSKKPCSQLWLQQLAREFKCTVFSVGINTNFDITTDHEKYYIYQEAGWFEVIFDIQAKLAKRFGFPKRKLLLIGESSGGSMIQRITAAYPDRVAAAAWCGGSRYDMSRIKKDNIPRLILNTWGCPGESASKILAQKEKDIGNSVLVASMPPDPTLKQWYHHAPGPESYRLIQEYIGGMAELIFQNGGILPKPSKGTRLLPASNFATSWKQRFLPVSFHGSKQVFVMQPYAASPKQIAIVLGSSNGETRLRMLDALYWFSQKDTIPIQVNVGNDLFSERSMVSKILKLVLEEKEWEGLPIIIIGLDEAGQTGTIAALADGNSRIRKIWLYNCPYDSPFSELSIIKNCKNSSIPILICSEEIENEQSFPHIEFRKFSVSEQTNFSWKAEIDAIVAELGGVAHDNKAAVEN